MPINWHIKAKNLQAKILKTKILKAKALTARALKAKALTAKTLSQANAPTRFIGWSMFANMPACRAEELNKRRSTYS